MIEKVQTYDSHRPWSLKTVAHYLGYSVAYTYKLAREGVIPGRKVRGRWYFNPAEIRAYVGFPAATA